MRRALIPFVLVALPMFTTAFNIQVGKFLAIPYGCVLLLLLVSMVRGRFRTRNLSAVKSLLVFEGVTLLLYVVQLVLGSSELNLFLFSALGIMFSVGLVVFFLTMSEEQALPTLRSFFVLTILLFFAQLAFSIQESHSGFYYFGDNSWVNYLYANTLATRVIFAIFSANLPFLNYLQLPLSGMIGQWNHWGTMLPFYNLMVWALFAANRKRSVLFLLPIILLASILNTSRFGISAILVSDAVLYVGLLNGRRWVPIAVLALIIGVGVAEMTYLAARVNMYLSRGTNTLTPRIQDYELLIQHVRNMKFLSLLFGEGGQSATGTLFRVTGGVTQSFESQFFWELFVLGVPGLSVFLFLLYGTWRERLRHAHTTRLMIAVLVMNMVAVSLTSNLVFSAYIFPFVTVLFIYLGLQEKGKPGKARAAESQGPGGQLPL